MLQHAVQCCITPSHPAPCHAAAHLALGLSQEDGLEGQHARNGQQDRGVLWDQGGTGHARVAAPLIELQERLADLGARLRVVERQARVGGCDCPTARPAGWGRGQPSCCRRGRGGVRVVPRPHQCIAWRSVRRARAVRHKQATQSQWLARPAHHVVGGGGGSQRTGCGAGLCCGHHCPRAPPAVRCRQGWQQAQRATCSMVDGVEGGPWNHAGTQQPRRRGRAEGVVCMRRDAMRSPAATLVAAPPPIALSLLPMTDILPTRCFDIIRWGVGRLRLRVFMPKASSLPACEVTTRTTETACTGLLSTDPSCQPATSRRTVFRPGRPARRRCQQCHANKKTRV